MRLRWLAAIVLTCAPLVASARDLVVAHQGRLLDNSDVPVNGPRTLTFRLFTKPSDPEGATPENPKWSETYETVVTGGAYTVLLGGGTNVGKAALPSSLFTDSPDIYLEVQVGEDPMKPRMRFSSAPIAGHADTAGVANKALALDCTGCIAKSHLAAAALEGIDAASVGGVTPSATPAAGGILKLDENGKIPLSVIAGGSAGEATPGAIVTLDLMGKIPAALIPGATEGGGIDATTVRGFAAAATPTANNLLVLDGNGKVPAAAIPGGLDAATFGGKALADFALKTDLPKVGLLAGSQSLFDSDGDGRIDGSLLPPGMFQRRILSGGSVYLNETANVTPREITFYKQRSDTVLEVTSSHSGGGYMNGEHTSNFYYEIRVDSKLVGYGYDHNANGNYTGYTSPRIGYRMWPRTEQTYVSNIPAGVHRITLQMRGYENNGVYYAWTGNDLFEVREVPAAERRVVQHFTTARSMTATDWTAVPDRQVTYTKTGGSTVPLLVTIQDTWGAQQAGDSSALNCQWMLYMNDFPVGRDLAIRNEDVRGYLLYGASQAYLIPNRPADTYTFKLFVKKASTATNCYSGSGGRGFMSVVELDPDKSAFAKDFPNNETVTTTSWGSAHTRATVSYTKKEAATDLRVTYQDTTGYLYKGTHSYGCRWALTRTVGAEEPQFVAYAAEHTSAITGERHKPMKVEFVLPDLPAEAATYKIVAIQGRSGSTGANCKLGYTGGGTGVTGASSFLLVRETPRNED